MKRVSRTHGGTFLRQVWYVIGFWAIMRKIKHVDKRRYKNPTPATAVGVGNNITLHNTVIRLLTMFLVTRYTFVLIQRGGVVPHAWTHPACILGHHVPAELLRLLMRCSIAYLTDHLPRRCHGRSTVTRSASKCTRRLQSVHLLFLHAAAAANAEAARAPQH